MTDVRDVVLGLFREKPDFRDVAEDQDYFELGVSSLTIVELQIKVEDVLNVTIPTSQLMRLSCINDWVAAYETQVMDVPARQAQA